MFPQECLKVRRANVQELCGSADPEVLRRDWRIGDLLHGKTALKIQLREDAVRESRAGLDST